MRGKHGTTRTLAHARGRVHAGSVRITSWACAQGVRSLLSSAKEQEMVLQKKYATLLAERASLEALLA